MEKQTIVSDLKWSLIIGLFIGVSIFLVFMVISAGILDGDGEYQGTKTYSFIKMLDMACQSYEKEFTVYPPQPPGDSSALHLHLGSPRTSKPPIVSFTADMLELPAGRTDLTPNPPVKIIDGWGNPIRYLNPGIHNTDGVDIWSAGKNGIFEADSNESDHDDITNWDQDF